MISNLITQKLVEFPYQSPSYFILNQSVTEFFNPSKRSPNLILACYFGKFIPVNFLLKPLLSWSWRSWFVHCSTLFKTSHSSSPFLLNLWLLLSTFPTLSNVIIGSFILLDLRPCQIYYRLGASKSLIRLRTFYSEVLI